MTYSDTGITAPVARLPPSWFFAPVLATERIEQDRPVVAFETTRLRCAGGNPFFISGVVAGGSRERFAGTLARRLHLSPELADLKRDQLRWQMNLSKLLSVQAVLIAMGAAMLIPSTVHSQEVENKMWNDGTNVASYAQPGTDSQAATPAASAKARKTDSVRLDAASAAPAATQEANLTQASVTGVWVIGTFLLCIGLVRWYTTGRVKFAPGNQKVRDGRSERKVVLY